jgi:LysM repeat protein
MNILRCISLLFVTCVLGLSSAWGQLSFEDTTSESEDQAMIPEINQFRFHKILKDTIALDLNDILVCDSFSAQGMPSTYDALHSFNYRIVDRFGGYLNIKVNLALEQVRNNGFPSDVKKLYIQIDPVCLKVYWFAVVGPSTDGRSYVRIDSRGSAGGGLSAVQKQLPRMINKYPNFHPHKLMEFNENVKVCYDWHGNQLCDFNGTINIRQHFYKFSAPPNVEIPPVEDTELLSTPVGPPVINDSTAVKTTPSPVKSTPKPSYKIYKVKTGDTLSEIAGKHHVSIAAIKKANHLRSDTIQIGQNLKIPR